MIDSVPCACGCGMMVWPSWVAQHRRYAHNKNVKPPKSKPCKCGCGEFVTPGKRFIVGHGRRGLRLSREAIENLKRPDSDSAKWWAKFHPFIGPHQLYRLKAKVRDRDNRRCCLCGRKEPIDDVLIVHHVVPISIGYSSHLCDRMSNLISVCKRCHLMVEPPFNRPSRWQEFLPKFRKYLLKFGYRRLLLNRYLEKPALEKGK